MPTENNKTSNQSNLYQNEHSHSDYYYELQARPSSHFSLFSDFLSDTLPVGFEENGDLLIVRSEEELETISWGLEQFAEALSKALKEDISIDIEIEKKKNSDWVKSYQESITPVEVGDFYIYPTWDEPKEGKLNIVLDPALAFGTGHHPTTSTCLQAISKYVHKDETLLDVGCGSGILAIAAAKKGAIVDACDTDAVSVENTKENILQNEVELKSLFQGSASNTQSQYDVVIANIVADVLTFIANDLKKIMKKNSTLILSGIMDKYEGKVLKFYSDLTLVERIEEKEWVTLVLTNKGKDA